MSDSPAGPHDWSQHRKPPPVDYLLPASEEWIDLLPPAAFPGALATHYPRIVNLIAILWNDHTGCFLYFDPSEDAPNIAVSGGSERATSSRAVSADHA